MRWIKDKSESGTIALIVAILVSSSLVIGMFVIVADTGSLFQRGGLFKMQQMHQVWR